MKAPESHIIETFTKGTPEGFNNIYDLYYGRVRHFAYKLLNNHENAKDVAISSFIKLFERYAQFTTEENVRAFLFAVTRNACFDLLKHQQMVGSHKSALLYLAQQDEESLDVAMIEEERINLLHLAIEQLPPKRKAVITMLYIQGLAIADIAQQLNLSKKTVKNYRGLAIEDIRTFIASNPLQVVCLLYLLFPILIHVRILSRLLTNDLFQSIYLLFPTLQ